MSSTALATVDVNVPDAKRPKVDRPRRGVNACLCCKARLQGDLSQYDQPAAAITAAVLQKAGKKFRYASKEDNRAHVQDEDGTFVLANAPGSRRCCSTCVGDTVVQPAVVLQWMPMAIPQSAGAPGLLQHVKQDPGGSSAASVTPMAPSTLVPHRPTAMHPPSPLPPMQFSAPPPGMRTSRQPPPEGSDAAAAATRGPERPWQRAAAVAQSAGTSAEDGSANGAEGSIGRVRHASPSVVATASAGGPSTRATPTTARCI